MDGNPKKPPREAVALEYWEHKNVPRVIAAGKGQMAESIIEKARRHAIPVYEDPNLAHTLNLLRIGDDIPPELYEVVARILVFVSDVDRAGAGAGN
ncbi:MAG: EscU/YscU/HrcU family type III secretion system export apparatus switch protein [Oscillospiraceae bacterium]|nr:EscU/YscU/HrcU family type III secretion system export apparatus switch protein [Oscillospiraceae bacterium]